MNNVTLQPVRSRDACARAEPADSAFQGPIPPLKRMRYLSSCPLHIAENLMTLVCLAKYTGNVNANLKWVCLQFRAWVTNQRGSFTIDDAGL